MPERDKYSDVDKGWKISLSPIVVAIITAIGVLGSAYIGAVLQDRSDILSTEREIAKSYSDAANKSAETVDDLIKSMFAKLRSPNSKLNETEAEKLRNALLDLQRDVQRLANQLEVDPDLYQTYVESMVDLASAAEDTTGAIDGDGFVEAYGDFYLKRMKFEKGIASNFRPSST